MEDTLKSFSTSEDSQNILVTVSTFSNRYSNFGEPSYQKTDFHWRPIFLKNNVWLK